MDLKELSRIAKRRRALLLEDFPAIKGEPARALAFCAKANEEMGELTNEILMKLRLQRNSKLREAEIEKEIADVMLTTAIIAAHFDIDLDAAVTRRIAEIEKRTRP